MLSCYYHPGTEAVAGCVRCHNLICGHCRIEKDGKAYCPHCYLRVKYAKKHEPVQDNPENIKLLIKKMVERLGNESR
jgi:uncharacterized Zn finger protein (UPF0148 family)